MNKLEKKIYYRQVSLSELLKCSLSKLRQDRCQKKGIPYTRLGRMVLYDAEDVDRDLASKRVETD